MRLRQDRFSFQVHHGNWLGLEVDESRASWVPAKLVPRRYKGTKMGFATFSWRRWQPLHVSRSASPFLALTLSLWVFPLHRLTNKKTSCFWPVRLTKRRSIITALLTFRFARQHNGPPNQELNRVVFNNSVFYTKRRRVRVDGPTACACA